MLKSKKIIAIVAIVFLIIAICVQVKATDNQNPLTLPLLSDDPNTTDANATIANAMAANSIYANQVVTNSIYANQVAANSMMQPTINSQSSDEDLPQTGVTEDITVMFFIIVCVISAIYAYRKIRDYNL